MRYPCDYIIGDRRGRTALVRRMALRHQPTLLRFDQEELRGGRGHTQLSAILRM